MNINNKNRYYNGGGYNGNRGGYNGNNGGGPQQRFVCQKAEPQELPDGYVDKAEQVITKHRENKKTISTSKLRNLFSLVSDIYNEEIRVTGDTLSEDSVSKLMSLRIRAVYEAGRDDAVKDFIIQSELLSYIKWLENGKSRKGFLNFAKYMEALVAYHRFIIGGKEG